MAVRRALLFISAYLRQDRKNKVVAWYNAPHVLF
jgi:hypothetical protein